MATQVKIECINKTNRSSAYERVQNVGGRNGDGTRWRMSVSQAIEYIENYTYSFYVSRAGTRVDVVIATNDGVKYLKTRNDDLQPNNLLSLPECP